MIDWCVLDLILWGGGGGVGVALNFGNQTNGASAQEFLSALW